LPFSCFVFTPSDMLSVVRTLLSTSKYQEFPQNLKDR